MLRAKKYKVLDINKNITKEIPTTVLLHDTALPVPTLTLPQSSAVVCVFSLLCFWNTQWAEFTFDDSSAILSNKDIDTSTTFTNVFLNDFWGTDITSNLSHKSYRPLTVLTYRMNFALGGGYTPWGFHFINIILHSLNSVFLLRVFSILLGGIQVGVDGRRLFTAPKASLLCAVIFAVHPIHTESVAAVVGRADLLCTFFFIISLLSYTKHCHLADSATSGNLYFIMFLCTAFLATFSKEQGITVLGVCIVYEIVMVMKIDMAFVTSFVKGIPSNSIESYKTDFKRSFQRIALIFLSLVGLLALRIQLMKSGPPRFTYNDNPASFQPDMHIRVLNYMYLYSINVWLLVSPNWLCFDWSMGCVPLLKSFADWRVLAPVVMVAVILLLCRRIVQFANLHIARSLAMSLALLVIPFTPAMNILFRVGFVVAERNLYIPSIGYCMLLTITIVLLSVKPAFVQCMKYCTGILIVIFVARTVHRTFDWMDEMSLFKSGLDVCPLNAKVNYNVGKVYQDIKNDDTAMKYYLEAIRLEPNYDEPMNNLGNIYLDKKMYSEAHVYLLRAITVSPTFAAAWMNFGLVKSAQNLKEEAIACFTNAVLHRRNYPDAYYNWGNVHLDYNEEDLALEKFNRAIELKPTHVAAWQNKIILLGRQGKVSELMESAVKVERVFPGDSEMMYNLGNSFGIAGNLKFSERYLKKAIELDPSQAVAYASLGIVYHRLEKYTVAETYYKKSLSLNPDNQSAKENYRKLKKAMGK